MWGQQDMSKGASCWGGPKVKDGSVEGLECPSRDFGQCLLDKGG